MSSLSQGYPDCGVKVNNITVKQGTRFLNGHGVLGSQKTALAVMVQRKGSGEGAPSTDCGLTAQEQMFFLALESPKE